MIYRLLDSIAGIEPQHWDSLNRGDYPFAQHAFLHALERSGCVSRETGWESRHILLYPDSQQAHPVAAAPLYLKTHSWGEYVFDWAWADAYQRAGLAYYPKLVCAIPFTPATGPRLLVSADSDGPDTLRRALIDAVLEYAQDLGVSSVHWLFTDRADTAALEHAGLLKRTGNQFHWSDRGYGDFDGFLASLTSKRRKQIRRERRQVRESGVSVRMMEGEELTAGHWDAMYRFYQNTISERGAIPYLSPRFFDYLGDHMKRQTVMALAHDAGGSLVAGALYLKGRDTLYGRYWGANSFHQGLHFEACYYQPIEYCLQHGFARFEAGAQGEHKLTRGLVPTPTYSAHWLAHPRFAEAVRDFLDVESREIGRYAGLLASHSPFRRES